MNDSSLRFRDLILRVAQDAGMQKKTAGEADGIPTDPSYLQRVKDAINDGREFVYTAIDPSSGATHNWQCLREVVDIALPTTAGARNPDGDTSRVILDPSYQILDRSGWRWRSGDGSAYAGRIQFVHPEHVETRHGSEPDRQGHPLLAYVAPRVYTANQSAIRGGQILRVWPKPNADYVLTGLVRRLPHPLVDLDDVEPMGAAHSQTIVAAAMYVMRRSDPQLDRRDWYKRERDECVARSIQHDKLFTPIQLEEVVDGNLARINGEGSTCNVTVDKYNDVIL